MYPVKFVCILNQYVSEHGMKKLKNMGWKSWRNRIKGATKYALNIRD